MKKNRPEPITSRFSQDEYLAALCRTRKVDPLIKRAVDLAWQVQDQPTNLPNSLDVALILSELGADITTLVVTLLSDSRLNDTGYLENIKQTFDKDIAQMAKNLRWVHDFHLDMDNLAAPEQAERLRRMLLSMVEDVRVVLIKLAYRVQRLRILADEPEDVRTQIARESMEIFAPLANRLGIGQLKWELEDLSFRYLEPMAYRRIAKLLEERREDREKYIREVVDGIRDMVAEVGIQAEIYGRPKHIFSIWKKMAGKQKEFDELFDVRAVRITVDTVQDCYTVLGLVHGKWRHIAKEFDDYIANPKENGYQSLHTAVYGPQGKPLEIQIRTHAMHQFAEYGVAAHWLYKEGLSKADENLERGITSLRKLLDPNETRDDELVESFQTELYPDRVFILTPRGKVMDLPQGSTPLDFAYAVHTEIGHRCRGAKVNGRIVPLTYELQNGEQVEVLTGKEPGPSRDWMNPALGYLQTSRARAKVKSWFRQQDYVQNAHDGKIAFDREVNRLDVHKVNAMDVAKKLKLQTEEEMYAALGRGDISAAQIASALHALYHAENKQALPLTTRKPSARRTSPSDEVHVRGVGNLLTSIANCCKPVPGDEIIGYITQGQGITVHRKDCTNILNLEANKNDRLIEAQWGGSESRTYPVSIYIEAIDRQGLLRDVSKVFADEHVDVIGVNTLSNKDEQSAVMTITAEISDLEQLSLVMDKLSQLANVSKVTRSRT